MANRSTGTPKMIAGEDPPPPPPEALAGSIGFGTGCPAALPIATAPSIAARPSASELFDFGFGTLVTAPAMLGLMAAVPYPFAITTSSGLGLLNAISLWRKPAYG